MKMRTTTAGLLLFLAIGFCSLPEAQAVRYYSLGTAEHGRDLVHSRGGFRIAHQQAGP